MNGVLCRFQLGIVFFIQVVFKRRFGGLLGLTDCSFILEN